MTNVSWSLDAMSQDMVFSTASGSCSGSGGVSALLTDRCLIEFELGLRAVFERGLFLSPMFLIGRGGFIEQIKAPHDKVKSIEFH